MRKKTEIKPATKKAKPAVKRGAKRKYDPALFVDEICERLMNGETLRSICRGGDFPSWQVVYEWANQDDEITDRIARAREAGFDAIAMQALEIADTPQEGESVTEDDKGTRVTRGDMLGHRKLQVDTRLKLLAKWCPGRYGDKVQIAGSEDLPPLAVDDTSTAARLSGLLALAAARAAKDRQGA